MEILDNGVGQRIVSFSLGDEARLVERTLRHFKPEKPSERVIAPDITSTAALVDHALEGTKVICEQFRIDQAPDGVTQVSPCGLAARMVHPDGTRTDYVIGCPPKSCHAPASSPEGLVLRHIVKDFDFLSQQEY